MDFQYRMSAIYYSLQCQPISRYRICIARSVNDPKSCCFKVRSCNFYVCAKGKVKHGRSQNNVRNLVFSPNLKIKRTANTFDDLFDQACCVFMCFGSHTQGPVDVLFLIEENIVSYIVGILRASTRIFLRRFSQHTIFCCTVERSQTLNFGDFAIIFH